MPEETVETPQTGAPEQPNLDMTLEEMAKSEPHASPSSPRQTRLLQSPSKATKLQMNPFPTLPWSPNGFKRTFSATRPKNKSSQLRKKLKSCKSK